MKKCIECGDKVRNERSSLCEKCFDEALERKVVKPPEQSWW